jgi:hypothetical protein
MKMLGIGIGIGVAIVVGIRMLHSIAIPIATPTPIPTPTFRVGRSIFEAGIGLPTLAAEANSETRPT